MDRYLDTLVSSWVESRMELDRSLISLSSAGVGLLVALSGGNRLSPSSLTLAILSCFGFIAAIVSGIEILRKNPKYIEKLWERAQKGEEPEGGAQEQEVDPEVKNLESSLDDLDKNIRVFFYFGMSFLILLGIALQQQP